MHKPSANEGQEKETPPASLISRKRKRTRLIIISLLSVAGLAAFMLVILLPGMEEKLTRDVWCVDEIRYKGRKLETYKQRIRPGGNDYCDQQIIFKKNGEIRFPGIHDYRIQGHWKWKRGKLTIFLTSGDRQKRPKNAAPEPVLTEKTFGVRMKDDEILITSENMRIKGKAFSKLADRVNDR